MSSDKYAKRRDKIKVGFKNVKENLISDLGKKPLKISDKSKTLFKNAVNELENTDDNYKLDYNEIIGKDPNKPYPRIGEMNKVLQSLGPKNNDPKNNDPNNNGPKNNRNNNNGPKNNLNNNNGPKKNGPKNNLNNNNVN